MHRLTVIGLLALALARQAAAQEWIPLQDGTSLAGWKPAENPASWLVEDGMFVSRGERSHLFYVGDVAKHDFRNFEFSADVMTEGGANSGIYVHTKWQGPGWPAAGYEMQVINSNPLSVQRGEYIEHKMTGSIYAVRNTWVAPAKNYEWFNYRIRVVGRTIQTFINDKLICEYAESENPYRPEDKKGRLLGSGTFALQAHDPSSVVKYKNIKVKILPNKEKPPAGLIPIADRELDELITQASNDNIPLVDPFLMPPEKNAEKFWSEVRRYGMTVGSEFASVQQEDDPPTSVLVEFDTHEGPNVELLKAAKAAGTRMVFSASNGFGIDPARLKTRLLAIKAAALDWKDFVVPGKP